MQYRAALAIALAPVAAAFTVSVTNKCEYIVYGWNVVDNYGQTGDPTFTLSTGQDWSGEFDEKSSGGGPSIKLQKLNSLFENAQQSQVEYKLASGTLFYDLSNINGYPFSDGGITMETSNSGCPTVNCLAGEATCSQAYNTPDDLRTLACAGGADISVTMCPGGSSSSGSTGGSSSSSSSSSPPPTSSSSAPVAAPPAPKPTTLQTHAAPAPTPAPAAPAAGNGDNFLEEGNNSGGDGGDVEVVYATKLIAVTSTVVLPAPSSAPEDKREAHLHAHIHRGHSRVMGRHAH